MNELEKFPEKVREIVVFALDGNFLFGSGAGLNLKVKCVPKPPKDWISSGPGGKSYWEIKEGELTYQEIREENRTEIRKEIRGNKDKRHLVGIARRIMTGQHRLYTLIKERLNDKVDDSAVVAEIIVDDLLSCAEWKICFENQAGFWDTVFQIYQSGGMPVGWSGNYPDGCLIAFYPELKS